MHARELQMVDSHWIKVKHTRGRTCVLVAKKAESWLKNFYP